MLAGGAARLNGAGASLIDPAVEILQVGQIGREQVLDHPRVDVGQVAEPGDHPREQDDHQVGLVGTHAGVAHGGDLIHRRGEAHDPVAMKVALAIHVAAREREFELGLE